MNGQNIQIRPSFWPATGRSLVVAAECPLHNYDGPFDPGECRARYKFGTIEWNGHWSNLLVVVVDGIASEIINKMARLQFPSQISPSEYY